MRYLKNIIKEKGAKTLLHTKSPETVDIIEIDIHKNLLIMSKNGIINIYSVCNKKNGGGFYVK